MGFKDRKRKEELKLSEKVAEQQLGTFLDYYDIFPDEMGTEAERVLYNMSCAKLITAIRKGRLSFEIDAGGELTIEQTIGTGDNETTISYKELIGSARIQDADKAEIGESAEVARVKRVYSLMGSLSGLGMKAMMDLKGNDLSTLECLGFLFLNL